MVLRLWLAMAGGWVGPGGVGRPSGEVLRQAAVPWAKNMSWAVRWWLAVEGGGWDIPTIGDIWIYQELRRLVNSNNSTLVIIKVDD